MHAEHIAAELIAQADRANGRPDLAAEHGPLVGQIVGALKQHVDAEKMRNPRRALAIAELAVAVAARSDDAQVRALAQWACGNACYHLSRYQDALNCFQAAQSIYVAHNNTISVLSMQINQVAVLQDMSAFQAALELAEQARATCRTLGSAARRYLASLEMNAGAAYQQIGAQESALAAYERGRAIFSELQEQVETARIDINRANVLQEMGRFAAAEQLFGHARAVLVATGQYQEVARADHNLGKLAYRRGYYQAALHHLEAAHSGFAAIPNPLEMATVNLYRSQVYRDLNMPQESITLAATAEQSFRRGTAPWLRAVALSNQSSGYQRLGAYSRAAALLQRARRIYQQMGAQTRVLLLDVERAYLAWQEGELQRAQRIARRLLQRIDADSWPEVSVRLHILLARCALSREPPELATARREAGAAQEIAERYQLPARIVAAHLAGQVAECGGDPAAAWQHYHQALHRLEGLRATLPLDELQLGLREDKQALYADAVRLGRRFADAAHFFALLNLAYAAPVAGIGLPTAVDPAGTAIQAELQQLREQWHWQQGLLDAPGNPAGETMQDAAADKDEAVRRQLRELESRIADLLQRRRVRNAANRSQGSNIPGIDDSLLAAVQGRLAEQDLLLILYATGEHLEATLVTRDSLHCGEQLASVSAIQRMLRAWRFQLEHGLTQQTGMQSARFYQMLLAPLETHLAGRQRLWLVLPPGRHDLPMAAMHDGRQYLVERFQLSYLSAPEALLQAGPLSVTAPQPQALIVGYSEQGRLPQSISEARQVADTLAPAWSPVCLLEEAATIDALRRQLGTCDLLHLASHAVFRPDNPLFSWIRLADGRLTVADLSEISLPCRPLVVLSACETGRGQARGGGLLGMGRGFLAAGAAGIVVSLWKIDDAAAAQLMQDFYAGLQAGSPADPAAALCQAQRRACARGAHPRDWAAFLFIAG